MPGTLKNVSGRLVQKFRLERNLSQEAFAAACQRFGWDISRGTISKIEAGLRCVSDAEVVLLAHVLQRSPLDLLPNDTRVCLAVAVPGRTA
jgi:transcriptional regulator with XRE-family HTH domain